MFICFEKFIDQSDHQVKQSPVRVSFYVVVAVLRAIRVAGDQKFAHLWDTVGSHRGYAFYKKSQIFFSKLERGQSSNKQCVNSTFFTLLKLFVKSKHRFQNCENMNFANFFRYKNCCFGTFDASEIAKFCIFDISEWSKLQMSPNFPRLKVHFWAKLNLQNSVNFSFWRFKCAWIGLQSNFGRQKNLLFSAL